MTPRHTTGAELTDRGGRAASSAPDIARLTRLVDSYAAEPATVRHRAAWRDRAACRGLDPDLFHPERGASTQPAKDVCARCPVREACLVASFVPFMDLGVWGGRSGRERRRLRTAITVHRRQQQREAVA